jgi:uncharacterized protein YcaQ
MIWGRIPSAMLAGVLILHAPGQALAQDGSATRVTTTAPSPVSPFDPVLLERIRQAITERMRARLPEPRDE